MESGSLPDACTETGCRNPVVGRGWCRKHYSRWWKHGTVEDTRPTREQRFWAKVDRRGPDDCWPWLGCVDRDGYGQFRWAVGVQKKAHRVAYEFLRGPIPDEDVIDHLCRNRGCANPSPAHMETVTAIENVLRGNSPAALAVRAAAVGVWVPGV